VLGAGSTDSSKEPSSDVMENKDKSKQNEHDSGMFQVKEISKTKYQPIHKYQGNRLFVTDYPALTAGHY
jgi:hypothetical protein